MGAHTKLPLTGKTIVVESGHGGLDVDPLDSAVFTKRFLRWTLVNEFSPNSFKRCNGSDAYSNGSVLVLSARTMFANRNGADFFECTPE